MFSAGNSAAKMAAQIAAQQRAKEARLKEKYGDKLEEVKKKAKEVKQQKEKEAREVRQQEAKARRHNLRRSIASFGGGSTADESTSLSTTSFQDYLHDTVRLPGGILKKNRKKSKKGQGLPKEIDSEHDDGSNSITSDLSHSERGASLDVSATPEHLCTTIMKRKVDFDVVEIREFPQELGDNPAVSSGVPLCLGWEHIGQRRQNLLLYEELRGVRRKRNAMILSARTRANLLIGMGYTLEEIADGTLEVERVKRDRAESLKSEQGWLGKLKVMDLVVGAASEASGRILGLARRSGEMSYDQAINQSERRGRME